MSDASRKVLLRVRINGCVVDLGTHTFQRPDEEPEPCTDTEHAVLVAMLESSTRSVSFGDINNQCGVSLGYIPTMLTSLRVKLDDRKRRPYVIVVRSGVARLQVPFEILESAAAVNGPVVFPDHILREVRAIPVAAVREATERVLLAHDFPRTMAINDAMVPNPAWTWDEGSPPPLTTLMHVDMVLLVRGSSTSTRELYCYWSPRWDAFLIPFSVPERRGPKSLKESLVDIFTGNITNADRLTVSPLGKFLISVKRNQERPGEAYMYIFQFHSLVFPPGSTVTSKTCGWHTLARLTDPAHREAQVNADVHRALRGSGDLFEGLPCTEFSAEPEGT